LLVSRCLFLVKENSTDQRENSISIYAPAFVKTSVFAKATTDRTAGRRTPACAGASLKSSQSPAYTARISVPYSSFHGAANVSLYPCTNLRAPCEKQRSKNREQKSEKEVSHFKKRSWGNVKFFSNFRDFLYRSQLVGNELHRGQGTGGQGTV
jgi:hypothetical protein